jgi:hypothetical protein
VRSTASRFSRSKALAAASRASPSADKPSSWSGSATSNKASLWVTHQGAAARRMFTIGSIGVSMSGRGISGSSKIVWWRGVEMGDKASGHALKGAPRQPTATTRPHSRCPARTQSEPVRHTLFITSRSFWASRRCLRSGSQRRFSAQASRQGQDCIQWARLSDGQAMAPLLSSCLSQR